MISGKRVSDRNERFLSFHSVISNITRNTNTIKRINRLSFSMSQRVSTKTNREENFHNRRRESSMRSRTAFTGVSSALFMIGLMGIIVNRRSIIVLLMCIELMLLAVNLQRRIYSVYLDDRIGQVFALYVLTVAAAESAIGLGILVVYFRVRGSIAMQSMNLMRG